METPELFDFRALQDVSEQWRGNFGRWLRGELVKYIKASEVNGRRILPNSLANQCEREMHLGAANTAEDLLNSIPTWIDEQLKKEQSKQEKAK